MMTDEPDRPHRSITNWDLWQKLSDLDTKLQLMTQRQAQVESTLERAVAGQFTETEVVMLRQLLKRDEKGAEFAVSARLLIWSVIGTFLTLGVIAPIFATFLGRIH